MRRITMLRRAAAVLGLALVAATAGCEWPEGTRFVNEVFPDVDVTSNVVYRSTTDWQGRAVDLRLDIYQPRGDSRAERPVVMWMFGGGWTAGDKSQMAAYARDSARRGYVGVSIDYRIRPGGPGDLIAAAFDAYDDSIAAIEWLKAHAGQYRLDPDAIVAGGVSAGAINAVHVLYLPGTRGPSTSPAAGAAAISGVSFAAATAGRPPLIMHHGTNDDTIPIGSAQGFCDTATAAGNLCHFVTYEGGDHFIAFTDAQAVRDRTALFIFEDVLWPQGYRVEHVGG